MCSNQTVRLPYLISRNFNEWREVCIAIKMPVMEKYDIKNDIKVFGSMVKTFPAGIKETFDELIKKTGDLAGARSYYGISEFKEGIMQYYAVAEEKTPGESEKYD